MTSLLLAFLHIWISFTPSTSNTPAASGIVFFDKNGNGLQDRGEPGLANVVVSDQEQVVLTDDAGKFQFESTRQTHIIISQPKGYQGAFWKRTGHGLSFPLVKTEAQQSFQFIHASDTHIDSLNLPRMARFRDMVDSIQPAFVIVTGDLIRDALRVNEQIASAYYKMYVEEIEKINVPVYSGVGNHELFGIERDKSLVSQDHPLYGKKMYKHFLGPNYYSFNYGGMHFVSIDGLAYQNLYYYGGIDSLQLTWLEKDLGHVAPEVPIVTFNHIPLVSPGFSFQEMEGNLFYGPRILTIKGKQKHRHIVENYEDLKTVLGERPFPLALSGHYHAAQEGNFIGNGTLFAQTSAITRPDRFKFKGFEVRSGFTLYTIEDAKIIKSEFLPLNFP